MDKHFLVILFIFITNEAITCDNMLYPLVSKRDLIDIGKEGILLKSTIGKSIIASFLLAVNKISTTTSCRLENKRIVHIDDLNEVLQKLYQQGYALEDREVKNLPAKSRAGTFTFYGNSIKFKHSPTLPKTSIKLRIRSYIIDDDGYISRSNTTRDEAFLEIKIKNPFPEYPLSVHKYRLKMPDKDILLLINSDPKKRNNFIANLKELALRAHHRDIDNKDNNLIDTMFAQIYILAQADNLFIRPSIAITYFRSSKKYDEEYMTESKKIRTYEITIDDNVKAFYPDFSDDNNHINIAKYFINEPNIYSIANFPSYAMIVEFKQPDAIGYDGIGRFKKPENMEKIQKDLWQAFVGDLLTKALLKTRPDRGKFAHVKQYLRIKNNQARYNDETILYL